MGRFGRSKKSGETERKPDGSVRQSQLVGAYGAGAMIDLVQHAVIVRGLESWKFDGLIESIDEPRLRDRLRDKYGFTLDDSRYFRLPPAGADDEPTPSRGIQVIEFPAFFVCQNPGCKRLLHRDALNEHTRKDGKRFHECPRGEKSPTVPVRFVGACAAGHLQDLPWPDLPHYGSERCSPVPELFFDEDTSGDFSKIRVRCACGESQKLVALMADAIKLSCGGKQPWLPHPAIKDRNAQNSAPCSERLTLLVRTASNSYFHVVVSALSVPDPANTIRDALSPSADRIRERYADGEGPVKDLLKYDYKGLVKEHGIENVLAAAVALATGAPAQRHPIRTGEYVQFTNAPPPTTGERFEERERFVARALPADAPALRSSVGTKLERIVLAHRLREVRVQVGFTRISPAGSDNQGEYDENVQLAPLSREADWLPASTVQGEGLFLQLSSSALREWENRPEVIARAKVLSDAYTTWHLSNTNANSRGPDATMPPFVGARFYLLHSLSHLLINSIAMECGYSASAIRERIYCGPYGDDPTDMAGILLYTGTVGSEGTLGGLVDQGNQLHIHLERAIESASLCSNDPVCAAHNPADDPAERFLEGAACHGCLFVSESSCERFNRYLDRSLVIPVIGGDMRTAFFDDIVLI